MTRRLFERFTARARQVVFLAQDESRRLGHDHIGSEHILLGLPREEQGLAARVLETLDVTLDGVRAEVERILGRGEPAATRSHPEGSARDVELTCPPLAPEVFAELERLDREKQAATDREAFAVAAAIRDAERRLRLAATRLVGEWRRHGQGPT